MGSFDYDALNLRQEEGVLFAEISAPPMNLLGPELVRDLVSLIQHAETDAAVQVLVFTSADPDSFISHVDLTSVKERVNAIALAPVDDFRRDSDLFGEGVVQPDAQARISSAMQRGLQTRDAEMDLAHVLG